jgi:hypothetical protein
MFRVGSFVPGDSFFLAANSGGGQDLPSLGLPLRRGI